MASGLVRNSAAAISHGLNIGSGSGIMVAVIVITSR